MALDPVLSGVRTKDCLNDYTDYIFLLWIDIEVQLMWGIWYGLSGATRAHAKRFKKDGNHYIIELEIVYK
jgi:hypothetical protein